MYPLLLIGLLQNMILSANGCSSSVRVSMPRETAALSFKFEEAISHLSISTATREGLNKLKAVMGVRGQAEVIERPPAATQIPPPVATSDSSTSER